MPLSSNMHSSTKDLESISVCAQKANQKYPHWSSCVLKYDQSVKEGTLSLRVEVILKAHQLSSNKQRRTCGHTVHGLHPPLRSELRSEDPNQDETAPPVKSFLDQESSWLKEEQSASQANEIEYWSLLARIAPGKSMNPPKRMKKVGQKRKCGQKTFW